MKDKDKTIQFPDEPNREYIRIFKRKFNLQNKTNDEIKQIVEFLREKYGTDILQNMSKFYKDLKDGDKVKLNIKAIKSQPDWTKMNEKYREFIANNSNRIFTVEFDPKHQNGILVCLKEDATNPKWLWWEGHLDLVKDGEE